MALTRQRSVSNRLEAPQIVLPKGKDAATETPFEPCAATASHFLFSQGSSIVVLHHDTLAVERRFQSHSEQIALISVDTVSERGQGRLVVTYDIGKTAIIWDLFTGEQISRFASFDPLLVAAWMRNGNIAFGNQKGDVILFEPPTSEHISARTIHDPITALAPSSDCKTYAIGYRNGSILLAALQPQFTILHTLNTSRSPSPIAMLTWHASSSKQKSDMLAIQNSDGDLRVWSVPKPPTAGQPRVIRILKRDESFVQGRNWVCWSRNGRIIQFSEGETWAWDVRTKDVNYIPVPTIEFVKGITAYGPTASLFTLGPENTIQQYDVDSGRMIAHIRHTPVQVPPTPPEDYLRQYNSSRDDELVSPLRPNRYEGESYRGRIEEPASAHSQSQSTGSKRSTDKRLQAETMSPAKTEQTATTFSMGAYAYNKTNNPQVNSSLPISPASATTRLTGTTGLRKGSRLRQEVVASPMTPDDTLVVDLFPFARARLSEVQQQSQPINENNMTPDDLRKHMLTVVFGWEDDIYALITDELSRHPRESLSALFLAKWLESTSEDIAQIMSSTPADTAIDWIRLALGVLDSRPESKKVGQVFVEKMLTKGEIHMAAVALLALGDQSDAIEVYVSNNLFLEAILLTCLLMPQEWERQSHLVRKWGEHVVENSQQHLAIRCFACTGAEPADSWVSPTAQMYARITSPMNNLNSILHRPSSAPPPQELPQQHYQPESQYQQEQPYQQVQPQFNPVNPHVSRIKGRGFEAPTPVALIAPPTPFRTAAAKGTRITPQTGGLKLITSFNQKPAQFRFPGLKTDDMTPINAQNITPIAESAIDRSALSPGGLGSYRLNNIASLNSAMSASARQRLPSIGETPLDVETPVPPVRAGPKAPPTPADSGSDKEKHKQKMAAALKAEAENKEPRKETQEPALTLLTSARYEPSSTPVQSNHYDADPEPQTALRPSTTSSWNRPFARSQDETSSSRMGSRGKKPDGLALQMLQHRDIMGIIPDPLPRPSTTDSMSTNFTMSPPNTGDSMRVKSPSVSGRSMDQYISSLDTAQLYGRSRSRNSSRPPKEEKSERKRSRHRKHKNSEDVKSSGKRSPSSPVPMSPEDFRMFTASVESFDAVYNSADPSASEQNPTPRKFSRRASASTTGTSRAGNRSRSAQPRTKQAGKGREAEGSEANHRGRSKSRKEGSTTRSPSSPSPMVPSEEETAEVEPALKFVSQNRNRLNRSTSRRPQRGTSARRDQSPDRRRGRPRSPSRQREHDLLEWENRRKNQDTSDDAQMAETIEKLDAMAEMIRGDTLSNPRPKDRTKVLAQAELEARRLSLARHPSAPQIPVPGQANAHIKSASEGFAAPPPLTRNYTDSVLRPVAYNASTPTPADSKDRPNTPRAMQAPANGIQDASDGLDVLTSNTYQLPARTYSAADNRDSIDTRAPKEIPQTMPRHPAFDHRVTSSRAKSRSRTRAGSTDGRRGGSREQSQLIPDDSQPMIVDLSGSEDAPEYRSSMGPTIIPELQHLAIPPPPPPPPAPPKDLRIRTDLSSIATIPLPRSAFPTSGEPSSATPEKQHRRTSSRNDGQLVGKIRGIADRMRSTSKPRDNLSRSPNIDEGIMSPYETVTMMPPPLSSVAGRR